MKLKASQPLTNLQVLKFCAAIFVILPFKSTSACLLLVSDQQTCSGPFAASDVPVELKAAN